MKKTNPTPPFPADRNADFLPYGRQSVDEDDISAVLAVLRGDWLTTGPAVAAFEDALCATTGAAHAIACSSGTAALHLAMLAAGIGPGDSVIVPANTFLATANAARLVGAEVVFADVDPGTGQMTAALAQAALDRAGDQRTRAVLPVYYAGQCAPPADMHAFARDNDLLVIEDACHALGTTYEAGGQQHVVGGCRHASMASFSFHPVKTITTGEGGAVMTNDGELAGKLRLYRNHGMRRDPDDLTNNSLARDANGEINPWYYEMSAPGLNYRASDLHCALGTSQLKRLPAIAARRRALVAHYRARLAPLAPRVRPLDLAGGCDPVWHLQVIHVDFGAVGLTRKDLMAHLHEQGIGTQVHYIPVPWQPYYRDRYGETEFPGARAHYDSCLSLPLFESLTLPDVDRLVDALERVIGGQSH